MPFPVSTGDDQSSPGIDQYISKKQEAGMLHIDIIQCGMQQTYMDLQGGAP